jgi:hypothetical protein
MVAAIGRPRCGDFALAEPKNHGYSIVNDDEKELKWAGFLRFAKAIGLTKGAWRARWGAALRACSGSRARGAARQQ